MVSNSNLLHSREVSHSSQNKVNHLIGSEDEVSHKGSSIMLNNFPIFDGFYLREFKYNLPSISKLTREFQCSLGFFPNFCIF